MDDLTIKANAEKERLMGSADDMNKVMNSNEFRCCVPVPYDGGLFLATPSVGRDPAWRYIHGLSACFSFRHGCNYQLVP